MFAVGLLEQWKNLKECFLVFFLPKQRNFKREIKDTKRFKAIEEGFQNEHAEAYLAFLAYVSQDLETFLLKFQYDETFINSILVSMTCR